MLDTFPQELRKGGKVPFSEVLAGVDWDQTTERIYKKTADDALRALRNPGRLTLDDFMALISPAAAEFRQTMARRSRKWTLERFGKTVQMFIPLYLTNSCTNSCVYCGFHISNPMPRTILTYEEMDQEYEAIRQLGPFENILLVTGENPALAGVDYLEEAIRRARRTFSNVKIEVMPLASADYARLARAGMNGVICFQETYNRAHYNLYHPRGMKSHFEWRLNGFDRMGAAGLHSIGMGVLVGLEEWRTDMTMMALHLRHLQRQWWRTKYSVNFPRMRQSENGGFQPNVTMSDAELAQLTFAFRLFDHDVDISYSTREPAQVRDSMCQLGVTTMSAESHTEPGGYATHVRTLEQFHVSDPRRVPEVCAGIKAAGAEPVFKDWDGVFV